MKKCLMAPKRFNMIKRIINRFTLKGMMLSVIVLISCAAACASHESLPAENKQSTGEKDAYSVFIYICGSDLETKHGAATKNIQELLDADIGENVNIVLQTGGTKKWRSLGISSENIQRYIIENGTLKLLESLPRASMGQAGTLADFLCYGIQSYPAENYAVILWNHGGGSISGIAFDEQYSYDALTLSELEAAFGKASGYMEDKLELICLDACLMATLETARTLAPFGNYMVASQEISPSSGWDYTAIAQGLSQNPEQDGIELGRTICDSYYEKCRKDQKEKAVTLSVIDLNRIPALTVSFELFCDKLKEDKQDLYQIARCIQNSLAYGGSTNHEGHSNLFDLGCFSENMDADEVSVALKDAVIYQRTGEQRDHATGLSFYYPQIFDKNEIEQYVRAFPDSNYSAFLTTVFSHMPQATVEFLDTGSVTSPSGLSVRLSTSSAKYVATVEFDLRKDNDGGDTTYLGTDNNLYDDWDAGLFTSDFKGYWISLDGEMLQCHPVDQTDQSLIFSAPILLNSVQTNLRFSYVFERPAANAYDVLEGHYEILGTWNGLDPKTGMSKTEVMPLEVGDEITILHEGHSGQLDPGKTVIYKSGSAIHDQPLGEGIYRYRFIITDIFGKTYTSDTAIFEIEQAAEENPKVILLRIEKKNAHSQ